MERKTIGDLGEKAAVAYLKNKGYKILGQNYITPMGEIDIIAEKSKEISFVEVKTRSSFAYGEAFLSVGAKKKDKYRKMALYYIMCELKREPAYRFDIISILFDRGNQEVLSLQHYENAYI